MSVTMTAGLPDGMTENERRHKERLRSEDWDVGNGTPPRFRYVILSTPRSGSELLCAYLRQRGIGVPSEYFGTENLAERLGCREGDHGIVFPRYLHRLEAKRTTPSGIFGLKLHPGQLEALFEKNTELAIRVLGHFNRIVVLRRRDKVLQAISLMRARLTGQYHVLAGDEARPVRADDDILFGLITASMSGILSDEHYAATLLSRIDPRKISALWYEDLSEALCAELAASLCAEVGSSVPEPIPDVRHGLPRKGDSLEAAAIKERYLAFITGGSAPPPSTAGAKSHT
jgi:trehalose 2-sulfotransferase